MFDYNSVHLENFPDVSKLEIDSNLVEEMDFVREICSNALFLRDKKNLRVRLPLNYIKIISTKSINLDKYKDIITDEINVKNIIFDKNINEYADFGLEIDLKKVGPKYGSELKNIMNDVKQNKYTKLNDGRVEIAGKILEKDEFCIKLVLKNTADNIQILPDNETLIELDFTISENLELEGIARDFVRLIQQKRKDANLNLSDRIFLSVNTNSEKNIKAIQNNIEYIQTQTLSKKLLLNSNEKMDFVFDESFDNEPIKVSFSVVKIS